MKVESMRIPTSWLDLDEVEATMSFLLASKPEAPVYATAGDTTNSRKITV